MKTPSGPIVALSAASALSFAGLILVPDVTINNFPFVERAVFVLFAGFLITGVLSVIMAAVRWRRIPAYARIVAVLPLGAWLLSVLVLKAGTPKISAELRYAGSKEQVIVDFKHGWGSSGFPIPQGGTYRDDDTGRATSDYRVDVREDYGATPRLSLSIDMRKEVPRLGRDRHLVVEIDDDAITYRVLKR